MAEILAITPFRFLNLLSELRLAIYPQVLFTDEPLHWIRPDLTSEHTSYSSPAAFLTNLLRARKSWLTATTRPAVSAYISTTRTTRTTSSTALLFTCKTIYHEAIEHFYRNNIFVIRAMTVGFQPFLRHQPFLLLVQRLCIQLRDPYDPSAMNVDDLNSLVDATVSSCL